MAPLPGKLLKLVFGGPLNGTEQWACSLHLAGTGQGEFVHTDLTPLLGPLGDWFNRQSSCTQGGATLDFIKLNGIARGTVGPGLPGGKQDPLKATNQILINPAIQPSTADILPGQLSQTITLRTEIARGRASAGRFYVPVALVKTGATSMESGGRLRTDIAQGMADSAQEMLSEINALFDVAGPWGDFPDQKFVCCVWSSAGQIAQAVERVAVGRVVDTQRRRRSSLNEDYQFSAENV